MFHKFIIIVVAYGVFMLFGLLSCDICGPFADKFKLISMDLKIYQMSYDSSSTPNLIRNELIGDTLDYHFVGLYLRPKIRLYYSAAEKRETNYWLMSANACSPSLPVSEEIITGLRIRCSTDFNDNYPQGSDLSSAFDIVVPAEAYRLDYTRHDLNTYLNTRPALSFELNLILKSAPAQPGSFSFTIEYQQEGIDVDTLTLKSEDIWIR